MPMKLGLPALESWLSEAACVIRGPVDAPKFKDYILPLIFLKRISDVFEDEIRGVTNPVLDAVLLGQLAKLNPGIVNGAWALDVVRRLVRMRPSIEGNLDAWEFRQTAFPTRAANLRPRLFICHKLFQSSPP